MRPATAARRRARPSPSLVTTNRAVVQASREHGTCAAKMELAPADFGASVRSYVLHPYKLVKDDVHESSRALDVLDGELGGFVDARLRARAAASEEAG